MDVGSHVVGGLDDGKASDCCSDYEDFGVGYFPGGIHLARKINCVIGMNRSYILSYQSDVYESKKKKEVYTMDSK